MWIYISLKNWQTLDVEFDVELMKTGLDLVRNMKFINNCIKSFRVQVKGARKLIVPFSWFYTNANRMSAKMNDGKEVRKFLKKQ